MNPAPMVAVTRAFLVFVALLQFALLIELVRKPAAMRRSPAQWLATLTPGITAGSFGLWMLARWDGIAGLHPYALMLQGAFVLTTPLLLWGLQTMGRTARTAP